MNFIRKFLCPFLYLLAPCCALAYDPAETFIAKPGTMPLIFIVPHDGSEYLGWVAKRRQGVVGRDEGTRDLAEKTAVYIEEKTGKRPYLVIQKTSRTHMDVNRKESEALEDPDVIPAYRAFHAQVAMYVNELSKNYPNGALLIDFHSNHHAPDHIARGTGNTRTLKRLIKKYGNAVTTGPDSISGLLESKGYAVWPATNSEDQTEHPELNGGFIVRTYNAGSKGIESIQLEFGANVKYGSKLPKDVADSLLVFLEKFF